VQKDSKATPSAADGTTFGYDANGNRNYGSYRLRPPLIRVW
jgi:hypothetical protein